MNILLCGSWKDDSDRDTWVQALRTALGPGHRLLLARGEAGDAPIEAAIAANPPPGSLARLPGLRLIQSLWAGVDRLLADDTLPPAVPVARMVDPAMNAAMAETALWAVLALHRQFFDYARQQRSAQWRVLPQRRADEVPVLVLGFGQMGRTAACRIASQGYAVTAWSRSPTVASEPGVRLVHGESALPAAAACAQVVVNLLPLTPATRGLLGERLFNGLPRGAGIVNLARGAHLVEDDLIAALDTGQISQAVLDVFAHEPLPAGHPFWSHPRVAVLPHAAAQTDPRSAAAVVANNIEALAAGRQPAHLVDRGRGY